MDLSSIICINTYMFCIETRYVWTRFDRYVHAIDFGWSTIAENEGKAPGKNVKSLETVSLDSHISNFVCQRLGPYAGAPLNNFKPENEEQWVQ